MYKEEQFRNKIIYYSFVMSIFVVGIHAYNIERYQLDVKVDWFSRLVLLIENNVRRWADICVPFFFIVSGYLFFRTFEMDKLFDKYKSRVKTVFIPYIVWCTIYYMYYCILTNTDFLYRYLGDIQVVPIEIQTWVRWLWVERYYTLWFLQDLLVLIFLSPIIYVLLKRWCRLPTGMLILAIMLLCEMGILPIEYNHINIYYFMGAYIGINYKDSPKIRNRKIISVALIILIMEGWFIAKGGELNPLLILLGCFALWEITNCLDYSRQPKWYFKITFFIYCMHDLLLEALEGVFFLVFGSHSFFALIDYVFMPLIVVGICICISFVLRKYLSKAWFILAGGRG